MTEMKVNPKSFILAILMVASSTLSAQTWQEVKNTDNDNNVFNHMAIGVTAGTTGIGVELAMPIGDYVQIRAGYTFMPSIRTDMHFKMHMQNYYEETKGMTKAERKEYDRQDKERFQRYADYYERVSGYHIDDDEITMIGRPTYYNGKLLVDVFPFKDKRWFLTGGFYYGAARVAKAYNSYKDMKLLVGIGLYNHILDQRERFEGAEIYLPSEEVDVYVDELFAGRTKYGVHFGDYFVEPDKDGMLKATVQTNRFKPYLGFGYGNAVPKEGKKYGLMLEAGLMMWGGTPKVMCYGEDLMNHDARGKVGNYLDIIRTFKVFPVVNLRISRRLF